MPFTHFKSPSLGANLLMALGQMLKAKTLLLKQDFQSSDAELFAVFNGH